MAKIYLKKVKSDNHCKSLKTGIECFFNGNGFTEMCTRNDRKKFECVDNDNNVFVFIEVKREP